MKIMIRVFLTIAITISLSAYVYSQANTTLSNLTSSTAVNQSLIPNTINTRDLGSSSRRWRLFYIDSAIYIKNAAAIHARGTGNFFAGLQAGNFSLTGTSNSGFGQLALSKLTAGINNVAFGYSALFATSSGNSNTAAGREAAFSNTTGSFNTALGFQSLFTNTSGAYNTTAGFQAGYFNKTGSNNIAIGSKALMKNSSGNYAIAIGDSALFNNTGNYGNVAIGSKALFKNTTGPYNIAVGYQALFNNAGSGYNTALGMQALFANSSGNFNTANGTWSLYNNTTGNSNIAVGAYSLYQNTTGNTNVAFGNYAARNNTIGYSNVAIGDHSLYANVAGINLVAIGDSVMFQQSGPAGYNTGVGSKALYANTLGIYQTAIGYQAMFNNTTGYSNTAVGHQAMYSNTIGLYNTAVGVFSMPYNTMGIYNTAIGVDALLLNSTGDDNTAVGAYSGVNSGNLSNATAIGFNTIATASNEVMLGNTAVTAVKAAGSFVIFSDGRYKKDVKENVPGLDFINQLRPVTYHYDVHAMNDKMGVTESRKQQTGNGKNDQPTEDSKINEEEQAMKQKEKKLYTGFVAQEVEAVAKKLNYDFSGVYRPENDHDLYGLSYSDFVVPLVKGMQELSADNKAKKEKIDSLESRIERLEMLIKNLTSPSAALSEATLDQNAPNPVKGRTAIGYNLPQHVNHAQIQITDAAGKLLKSVNLGGAGRGVLNLDVLNLSAGTYHYSLVVDGRRVDSKKMIVTK